MKHKIGYGVFVLLALVSVDARAAQPVVDEEEAIQKRLEWFYTPRRAGSEGRMAEKRAMAVEAVRATIERESGAAAAASSSWVPRGPFGSTFSTWKFGRVSGRISALAKDWTNGILYLGSASGGLWKSTNDGASWNPIFNTAGTQTVGDVAVDPSRPSTIWVGTGENSSWCEEYFGIGLLRSTDGGASWQGRNGSGSQTLENLSTFASIVIDPRNSDRLIVGGYWRDCVHGNYYTGSIFVTNDAGATWTKTLPSVYVTEIVQDPSHPDVLWAGIACPSWSSTANGGVYRSTDNGNSWTLLTASSLPTGRVGRVEVAVAPSNSNVVYALFESASGLPAFWRTTDGGASWSRMSNGTAACDGQCSYNMVLRVHTTNPDIVYRGTILIYRSTNGGASWTSLTKQWGSSQQVHQDTHVLMVDRNDPNAFYVGCDGGLWKTVDAGRSFKNLNSNLSLTQFYDVGIHPTNDGIIVGGAQDNSSLARTSSDTWALQVVTGDGFVGLINPAATNTVYATSYPYYFSDKVLPTVYRSKGGLFGPWSWITNTTSGIGTSDRINWVTPYTLDVHKPATMLLGTNRLYKSTNGGDHWTPVGPADMTGGGYESMFTVNISRGDGRYAYAGTSDGRVWRSTDSGSTWTKISGGLPIRSVNDVEPDPTSGSKAFCAVSGFGTAHLYEYVGSGNWIGRGSGLPDVPANTVVMINSKEILVGTDVGVFRSTDRGRSFKPFSTGMPLGLVITDLEYNSTTRTVTAGTYGRGAWQVAYP